ncbi:hypothetical protein C8Q77DRAFT_47719 [Trametes polyzona]|nr:hypothetical protein C8Q77DRAFT_47719 [Trametes polyzona]
MFCQFPHSASCLMSIALLSVCIIRIPDLLAFMVHVHSYFSLPYPLSSSRPYPWFPFAASVRVWTHVKQLCHHPAQLSNTCA